MSILWIGSSKIIFLELYFSFHFFANMKTQSDFLFRLIKSLTPSEKRYFKVYAKQKKGKHSVQLFEAIDKQKVYNEKAIKQKFAEARFVKHFPMVKNRLKKILLESLTEMHYHNHPFGYSTLKEFSTIYILISKGFTQLAKKKLEQIKEKHSGLNYLLASGLEWGLIDYQNIGEIDRLYKGETKQFNLIKKFFHYRWGCNKAYAAYVKYGLDKNKLKSISVCTSLWVKK